MYDYVRKHFWEVARHSGDMTSKLTLILFAALRPAVLFVIDIEILRSLIASWILTYPPQVSCEPSVSRVLCTVRGRAENIFKVIFA